MYAALRLLARADRLPGIARRHRRDRPCRAELRAACRVQARDGLQIDALRNGAPARMKLGRARRQQLGQSQAGGARQRVGAVELLQRRYLQHASPRGLPCVSAAACAGDRTAWSRGSTAVRRAVCQAATAARRSRRRHRPTPARATAAGSFASPTGLTPGGRASPPARAAPPPPARPEKRQRRQPHRLNEYRRLRARSPRPRARARAAATAPPPGRPRTPAGRDAAPTENRAASEPADSSATARDRSARPRRTTSTWNAAALAGAAGIPTDRAHRVERRAAHLVGEHALAGKLGAVEHVLKVCRGDVAPPHRRERRARRWRSCSRPWRQAPPVRRRLPPPAPCSRWVAVARGTAAMRRAWSVGRSGNGWRARKSRTSSPRSVEARRIRRWNRRRLARDPLDGQRLGRVERPPRTAHMRNTRVRVSKSQHACAGERVPRAPVPTVDGQQPAPQLHLHVASQPRDEVEVHGRDRRRSAPPPAPPGGRPRARAARPDRCAPARGSGAPAPDRRAMRLASSPPAVDAHEEIPRPTRRCRRPAARAGSVTRRTSRSTTGSSRSPLTSRTALAARPTGASRRAPAAAPQPRRGRPPARTPPGPPRPRHSSTRAGAGADTACPADPKRDHRGRQRRVATCEAHALHRHQRERRRRADRGREGRHQPPPAAAADEKARARRSATRMNNIHSAENPTAAAAPAPAEWAKAARLEADRGGGARPRPEVASAAAISGATRASVSVSTKKRTCRPFADTNHRASARRTTRWRAASPSLSSGSTTPVASRPRPGPAPGARWCGRRRRR